MLEYKADNNGGNYSFDTEPYEVFKEMREDLSVRNREVIQLKTALEFLKLTKETSRENLLNLVRSMGEETPDPDNENLLGEPLTLEALAEAEEGLARIREAMESNKK